MNRIEIYKNFLLRNYTKKQLVDKYVADMMAASNAMKEEEE